MAPLNSNVRDHMKVILIIVTFVFPMIAFSGDQNKFNCEDVLQDYFFMQAPHGARRISEHVLEVKYSAGVKKFVDKPPHDDFIGGLHWSYCGYNKNVKVHLIKRQENDLYSGSLLFDETGKVIKAGHTVIFSPNMRSFLAIEQSAGSDGQDWTLYDTSGHKHWTGFSTISIPGKPTDTYSWEAATIENPSLSDDLQISAHMFCWQSGKKGNVTLKKIGGKREWLPKIEC